MKKNIGIGDGGGQNVSETLRSIDGDGQDVHQTSSPRMAVVGMCVEELGLAMVVVKRCVKKLV